jgi:hypothetical protein
MGRVSGEGADRASWVVCTSADRAASAVWSWSARTPSPILPSPARRMLHVPLLSVCPCCVPLQSRWRTEHTSDRAPLATSRWVRDDARPPRSAPPPPRLILLTPSSLTRIVSHSICVSPRRIPSPLTRSCLTSSHPVSSHPIMPHLVSPRRLSLDLRLTSSHPIVSNSRCASPLLTSGELAIHWGHRTAAQRCSSMLYERNLTGTRPRLTQECTPTLHCICAAPFPLWRVHYVCGAGSGKCLIMEDDFTAFGPHLASAPLPTSSCALPTSIHTPSIAPCRPL